MNRNRAPRVLIALLVAALSLVLVVSALAAHPKAGRKYIGFTSAPAYRGLRPPVSFKVRRDAKRLLGFRFSEGDCGGLGGPGIRGSAPIRSSGLERSRCRAGAHSPSRT